MGVRVTGGALGGRRLRIPRRGVRPSADRVRESLFARLTDLEGAAVLDLFAGSGALGVEALSRGAASLVCVEQSREVIEVLRANLSDLGVGDAARVLAGDAARTIRRLGRSGERFDLVFLDPPYAHPATADVLATLVESEILAEGAVVVLERSRSHPVPEVAGLALWDERRYGDTVISRFRAVPEGPGAEPPGADGAIEPRTQGRDHEGGVDR